MTTFNHLSDRHLKYSPSPRNSFYLSRAKNWSRRRFYGILSICIAKERRYQILSHRRRNFTRVVIITRANFIAIFRITLRDIVFIRILCMCIRRMFSWKRAFHDDCKYLRASANRDRCAAPACDSDNRRRRRSRRRSRSCGESRDGGGRGCRVAASPVDFGRSVVVIIALVTSLYLPVKRITRALVAFHVPTRLFISEVRARNFTFPRGCHDGGGGRGGNRVSAKTGKEARLIIKARSKDSPSTSSSLPLPRGSVVALPTACFASTLVPLVYSSPGRV